MVRTIVVVTAVALLVLAAPLAVAVSGLYNGETTQRLIDDAARASAAIPGLPLSASDPVEITAAADGATVGIYTPDGARVAGAGPARADAAVNAALRGRVANAQVGTELVVALPIGSQEQVAGAVRAAVARSSVDDRVHRSWLIMGGFCLGAILIAGALAAWQARRLTRPLNALAHGAARLGNGDFTTRVPPSDVAEIDTVASALNTTSERLANVLERERAFSADASHQLRTPLTAVRLHLETALRVTADERSGELMLALDEIDRLEQTVDALLELARDAPSDRRRVDIAQLLAESEGALGSRVAAAHRPFQLAITGQTPAVSVSGAAVRQIVDVLVGNAIVHGEGTVRIEARELPGGVAIEVSDEGPGVTGDPDSVFERRHSRSGSSGVGLTLARSLAEAEGGRLRLIAPGPGPVFQLVFATAEPPSESPS